MIARPRLSSSSTEHSLACCSPGHWLRDGLWAARGDNNEMPTFLKALAWRDDCEFPEWESRQQKAYFEQAGLGQRGLRPAKCHPAIKLAADLKSSESLVDRGA